MQYIFYTISKHFRLPAIFLLVILNITTGCKKYLDLTLPANQLAGDAVFANNNAAATAVNNVFANMSGGNNFSSNTGISCFAGLYADEFTPVSTTSSTYLPFYSNILLPAQGTAFWSNLYNYNGMYSINICIEGLQKAEGLSMKNQLLGESYLMRALFHYYLTSLYGKIPIVTTSNAVVSNSLSRSPVADVFKQIIADARQAKALLAFDYKNVNGATTADRGRPNKAAAAALLARAYLYTGEWAAAAAEAGSVIDSAAAYQLATPAAAFLLNSKELIWGLAPQVTTNVVKDATAYYITPGVTPTAAGAAVILSPQQVAAFEQGDARFANWVGVSTVTAGSTTTSYYYPYKYKARATATTPTEYIAMFRLAELYLVRAEARARQDNTDGALADLNVVRKRAALGNAAPASKAELLAAILHERQVELFAELGHRLFDLRRSGTLDAVMGPLALQRTNTVWKTYMQYWPISTDDIFANPNLLQTEGYN